MNKINIYTYTYALLLNGIDLLYFLYPINSHFFKISTESILHNSESHFLKKVFCPTNLLQEKTTLYSKQRDTLPKERLLRREES